MTLQPLIRLVLIWLPITLISGFAFLTFQQNNASSSFGYNLETQLSQETQKLISSNDEANVSQILNNTKRILRRAPLNEKAFMFAAYGKYLSGQNIFSTKLLEHGHKLNARNKVILKALLFEAQAQKNISEIVALASLLYNLDHNDSKRYISILSTTYEYPVGADIIDQYLSSNTFWGYDFLDNKIKTLSANDDKQLNSSIKLFLNNPINKTANKNLIIEKYSKRLIEIKLPKKSLSFWSKWPAFNAENRLVSDGTFNPSFMKSTAPPPFNWRLFNNASVSAEYDNPNGLFISFRGSKPKLIVRQFIPWEEIQNVQLKIKGAHKYNKNKGTFFLELRCTYTNQLIANFDFANSLNESELITHELNVEPHSCNSAYLDLRGRPGIYGTSISMTLNYLDIVTKI